MANPDRPNGFRPVGTLNGGPWQALIRRAVMADTSADSTNNHGDVYVGTPIKLDSSGQALAWEQADNGCAGVCVGVGEIAAGNAANEAQMFNAANLEQRYGKLDDSAAGNTYIYYVPAEGVIFEAQTDTAITLQLTDNMDVNEVADTATGSRTTSQSILELTTLTAAADVKIVALPEYPDNDTTKVNARAHVMFNVVANPQT